MSESRNYETDQILDRIHPVSSSTQVNGAAGYVNLEGFARGRAVFQVGAIASTGTLTFQIRQAQDASGTGVKAFKAATALDDADDNKIVIIDFIADELDEGFNFIRIEAVAATAASIVSGILYGYDGSYAPVPTTLIEEIKI